MKNNKVAVFTIAIFTLAIACQSGSPKEKVSNKSTNSLEVDSKEQTQTAKKQAVSTPDTIHGIDVSHFQGKVNWKEVASSGMHFGIAKATQGITYVDPDFSTNWREIESNGLFRGAYHFFVASDDPIDQAKSFVKAIQNIGQHHLPPALDLEGANIGGLSVEQYQENVIKWLQYVEKEFGVQPMIYTNHPFGNQYLNDKRFSKYKLWIAEYDANQARIPDAWNGKSWTGWQFTEHDSLAGVNGSVDESRFLSSILISN